MTSLDGYLANMDAVAPPADGVDTGGVPTRTSSSAVAITAGSAWITVDGARKWCKIPAGSISSIPAASSGNTRFDLIVASLATGAVHGATATVSRVAGTQSTGTPAIPAVPAAAVPLALMRVTSSGIVDEPALIDQRWRARQRSRTTVGAGLPVAPLLSGQSSNGLPGATDGDEVVNAQTGDRWRWDGTQWRCVGSFARATIAAEGADANAAWGGGSVIMPLADSLKASIDGVFSRVSSGAGHAIRCAYAGDYLITAVVSGSGVKGLVGSDSNPSVTGTIDPSSNDIVFTSSVVRSVAANGDVFGQLLATEPGTSTAKVVSITVLRLGPPL